MPRSRTNCHPMFGTTRRRSVVMRGRLRGYFVKEKLVRNTLLRLAVLLVFCFSFLDLFWGTTRGHWIWTVGNCCVFPRRGYGSVGYESLLEPWELRSAT